MKIKIADVKLGDFLTPDEGFSCMEANVELEVMQDMDSGELYLPCAGPDGEYPVGSQKHYLKGQGDGHGYYVGFTKHRKASDHV